MVSTVKSPGLDGGRLVLANLLHGVWVWFQHSSRQVVLRECGGGEKIRPDADLYLGRDEGKAGTSSSCPGNERRWPFGLILGLRWVARKPHAPSLLLSAVSHWLPLCIAGTEICLLAGRLDDFLCSWQKNWNFPKESVLKPKS